MTTIKELADELFDGDTNAVRAYAGPGDIDNGMSDADELPAEIEASIRESIAQDPTE